MLIEISIAILLGILLGVFTGMTPGIHINLVAAIALSFSGLLLEFFPPLFIGIGLMVMSIVHVFVDFVPSIFLGAPSEATSLAVLPGHKLLLEGRAYEAVMLSSAGSLLGIVGMVFLLPVLIFSVPHIFVFLEPHIGILLLILVVFNVLKENELSAKFWALAVFSLAGVLGLITLNLPNLNQALLPLLGGLFGVSTLAESGLKNVHVPSQSKESEEINKLEMARFSAVGGFSGMIMGILPALGPAQSAMLAQNLVSKVSERTYLIMLGAVGSASMAFGLVTLITIQKARNGSIAILSEIVEVGFSEFLMLILVSVIAAGFAVSITSLLAGVFASHVQKISYRKISVGVIAFITCLTFFLSGPLGVLVLFTGSCIGLVTISKEVPRHNLMGCLMVPVMFFYF